MKGDLNILQHEALQWLLIDEAENEADTFETHMKFIVLAGTNPQLFNHIWPEGADDGEIEWLRPQSQDELDDILKLLESVPSGEQEV